MRLDQSTWVCTDMPSRTPSSGQADSDHVTAPTSTPAATERILDSTQLLQGRSHVLIRHEGVLYRLQATRLGKLILTK